MKGTTNAQTVGGTVGSDDKPIKFVNGRAVAVANAFVVANASITGATNCKITYDSKGLVTSGTGLSASDIPNLPWSKITSGKPTTIAGYGITDGAFGVKKGTYSGVNVFGYGLIVSGSASILTNLNIHPSVTSIAFSGKLWGRDTGDVVENMTVTLTLTRNAMGQWGVSKQLSGVSGTWVSVIFQMQGTFTLS